MIHNYTAKVNSITRSGGAGPLLHWGRRGYCLIKFLEKIARKIRKLLYIFLYYKKVTISNILHLKASKMHQINIKI